MTPPSLNPRNWFARSRTPATTAPETGEVAFAYQSNIYGNENFPRYNPDDLIGRKGHAIYRRMMLDEQVKAVVYFKRGAITSRPWKFDLDPDDTNLPEEECARRIRLFQAILANMDGSFRDTLRGIASAIYNGMSITEKVYQQIEWDGLTWWGLKKLALRPFDTFRFDTDPYGNITKIVQTVNGHEIEIDPERIIRHVHNPDIDEQYGQSELRACYRSWFSKDIVIKFRNIWLEKHAGGFRWLEPTGDRRIQHGSAEYNDLVSMMSNVSGATGMILPSGLKMNMQTPANQVAFEDALVREDKGIAKGLLVPNLLGITEQGDTGSYSQASVQFEAFLWTLDDDASRLEETLNEQLFRSLGEANFADGIYPRFEFLSMTDAQRQAVAGIWGDLVQKGAVKTSETDESHVRDLLDMPPKAEPNPNDPLAGAGAGAGAPQNGQDLPLDGAHIKSVQEIIQAVADGSLPADSAINLLRVAFPSIDDATARKIIDPANAHQPRSHPPGTSPGSPPSTQPDGPTTGNAPQGAPETIIGNKLVIDMATFERAMKRVDFKVIDRQADENADTHAQSAAKIMDQAAESIATQVESGQLTDPKAVSQLTFDGHQRRKLRNVMRKALEVGFQRGQKHADSELSKAKGQTMTASFDADRIFAIGQDFFEAKSFTMAGNLSDAAVGIIRGALLDGIKYTWSQAQTRKTMFERLARNGFISSAKAEAELGNAIGDVSNTRARIDTIIRTNVFDAINEGRWATFTDPGLDNFVQALEYSAILDRRTTSICEHLDGKTYAADSDIWTTQGYRPPNHFNCRSLLVAVTEQDTWTPSDPPTVEPQKGFA